MIGGERQLIAAAGRGAVDGADRFEPGILAQILDAVARLVGELAEIDLMRVARAGQHADIGAGGEHSRLGRAQHHDARLRVLEAQPLERVGQLDIDAEIVGIQLELVALEQRRLLVDVHGAIATSPSTAASSAGNSPARSGNRCAACRSPTPAALRDPRRPSQSPALNLNCTIMQVIR